MPDYANLAQKYTAAASKDVEPIIQEAAEAIDADDAARELLGGFLVVLC